MAARTQRGSTIEIFNFSFLDVLGCTIGFLIFILVTLSVVTAKLVPKTEFNKARAELGEYQKQSLHLQKRIKFKEEKLPHIEKECKQLEEKLTNKSKTKNFFSIFFLIILTLLTIILLFSYIRYKLMRRGDAIESHGEFNDGRTLRYMVGCYENFINIGYNNKKVTLNQLRTSHNTAFDELCRRVSKSTKGDRIFFWIHVNGNKTYNIAINIMREYGINNLTIGIAR